MILDTKGRPQVILPQEQLHWFMSQSSNVLSVREVQDKKFGLKYLRPTKSRGEESAFIEVLRPVFSRKIGKMQAGMFNTMRNTLDARMGLDETTWREVNLFETMHLAVFQSVCRALVGAPLCENDKFFESFRAFNSGIGTGAVIIGQYLPSFMTFLIGSFFSIFVGVYRTRVLRFIVPVAKERRRNTKLESSDPLFVDDWSEDLLTRALTTFGDATPQTIANDILTLVSLTGHDLLNRRSQ